MQNQSARFYTFLSIAAALLTIALLASGQSSTLTATRVGQIVMEGFLQFLLPPWLRRLISRLSDR